MFGSGKIRDLENRVAELTRKLDQVNNEKDKLSQELTSARQKVSRLESQLTDLDLEEAKKKCQTAAVEYEGLKDLYTRKVSEFDASLQEREQDFAREAAVRRFDLDHEILDRRTENEHYVASTVQTFSESYNYYLNQIKLLMDALGEVAANAGQQLFSGPNDDLKARIGQQMAEKLKAETDPLRRDTGDLILIGSAGEAEIQAVEEAAAEACAEEAVAEACTEEAAEACADAACAADAPADACAEDACAEEAPAEEAAAEEAPAEEAAAEEAPAEETAAEEAPVEEAKEEEKPQAAE